MPVFTERLRPEALALLCAVLFALTACDGDRARVWEDPLAVRGPFRVDQQALWLEGSQGAVFALDPSSDPPRVRRAPLGRHLSYVLPAGEREGESLLVLTAGQRRERADQRAEAPALHVIRAQGAVAPQVSRIELPVAFDRVVRSGDGRWALLHFGPEQPQGGKDGGSGTPALFHNLNEVAVVDLSADLSSARPTSRTLRSFGAAPLAALISPPLVVAGRESPLVLGIVLAPDLITLFDLAHPEPERREISVRLAAPATAGDAAPSSGEALPEQVLFAPEQGQLVVRAAGVSDVFVLSLIARAPAAEGDNDFSVTINQPSAGAVVRDMLLVPGSTPPKLLLATSTAQLVLLELSTGALSSWPLGAPVDTLLGVPAEAPRQVLAFARGQNQDRLQVIDLEGLLAGRRGAVATRSLGHPLREVVLAPSGRQAVLLHDEQRTALSILDLEREPFTDTPIQLGDAVGPIAFLGQTHLLAASAARPRLGILDLESLRGEDVPLEFPTDALLVVGDRLVLNHASGQGLVTVLPRPPAVVGTGRVYWGFLLDGLFDRALRD